MIPPHILLLRRSLLLLCLGASHDTRPKSLPRLDVMVSYNYHAYLTYISVWGFNARAFIHKSHARQHGPESTTGQDLEDVIIHACTHKVHRCSRWEHVSTHAMKRRESSSACTVCTIHWCRSRWGRCPPTESLVQSVAVQCLSFPHSHHTQ